MTKTLATSSEVPLVQQWAAEFVEGLIGRAVASSRKAAKRAALKMIREQGELSLDSMLDEVVRQHAAEGALYGAISGAVASIPGYGPLLATVGMLPETVLMLRMHCQLVVYLAHVYDPKMSRQRLRNLVALAVLGAVAGEATRTVVRRVAVKGLESATKPLVKRVLLLGANRVLRTIGLRLSRRGLVSKIPLISIPANAAACYAELVLAGKAYRKTLGMFHEPVACDCPWCDASFELDEGWGEYDCGECGRQFRLVP